MRLLGMEAGCRDRSRSLLGASIAWTTARAGRSEGMEMVGDRALNAHDTSLALGWIRQRATSGDGTTFVPTSVGRRHDGDRDQGKSDDDESDDSNELSHGALLFLPPLIASSVPTKPRRQRLGMIHNGGRCTL